jgi:hypothetical protein
VAKKKRVLKKMKKKPVRASTRKKAKTGKKVKTTTRSRKPAAEPEARPAVPLEVYADLNDTGFSDLCGRHLEIQAEIKTLKTEKGDLSDAIQGLMEVVEADSILGDEWVATHVRTKGRSTISRELLLKNGVTIDVVQKSTKRGEGSESVRITKKPVEGAAILPFPVADEAS